jgi:putative SOS response-associated peptidase YedK
MCYYSSIKSNTRDIVKEFDVIFPDSELLKPIYSASAFTFARMPVISSETPGQISLFQWGLIPFWVKNIDQANSIRQQTLNARSETVFIKPAFRQAIRSKRCLVIVDGFFEWRHVEKKKYPYYITLKSRKIFTLAGIWDTWTNPDNNEKLSTFSVVTTEANELMAKVHNSRKRMPLILPKEHEKTWLDLKQNETQIEKIMVPYNSADMKAYPVNNKLNRLGYNTIDKTVIEPFEYQELPALN